MTILFIHYTSLEAQNDNTSTMQPIGSEAFEVMRQFFSYDKDIPLDASIVEQIDEHGYLREKIVFHGPHDSRVPEYFNNLSPKPEFNCH